MTKILRMKMVQTIIIDQILQASDAVEVGPIVGQDLENIRQGAAADADTLLQPGMTLEQQIITAEVIEV
jgi:hypothetical protein